MYVIYTRPQHDVYKYIAEYIKRNRRRIGWEKNGKRKDETRTYVTHTGKQTLNVHVGMRIVYNGVYLQSMTVQVH